MEKVFNLITGKEEKVSKEELIVKKEKSNDFIVSVPHAGTLVFSKFRKNLDNEKKFLLDTDLYTDKIFDEDQGKIIISKLNPSQLNLNRFREGGDSSVPEHLRLDPLHHILLQGESVIKKEYDEQEKKELMNYYDEYHGFLQENIEKMQKEKGYALLFDFHSMNSIGLSGTIDAGEERPDFDITTLDDTSASPNIIEAYEKTLGEEAEKNGLIAKKNSPYRGGCITRQYANPKRNIHVIGVEIKRDLIHVEGIKESDSRFNPKPEGIKVVKDIISKAMKAASEAAEKYYN